MAQYVAQLNEEQRQAVFVLEQAAKDYGHAEAQLAQAEIRLAHARTDAVRLLTETKGA